MMIRFLSSRVIALTALTSKVVEKKFSWPIIALSTTFLTLVICPLGCNGEDPNWYKTHTETESLTEAIRIYGDDLLLDKIALTKDYDNHFFRFSLEHSIGGANDREEWKKLEVYIRYGVGGDYCYLYIYFDNNIEHPQEHFLEGSSETTIDGTVVMYRNWSGDDRWTRQYNYIYCAKFEYNSYTYYYEAYSHDNKDLFWDTIKQMLDK